MAGVGPRAISAGILLFRRGAGGPEVLLGHPGGPFWAARDAGHWTIPKGQPGSGEDLLAVARREFAEETGHELGEVPFVPLGEIRQKWGKVVVAWAVEGELDPGEARSNTFSMEWPPGSGRHEEFPEIDRVGWFELREARRVLRPAQVPFIDRLEDTLRAVETAASLEAAATLKPAEALEPEALEPEA